MNKELPVLTPRQILFQKVEAETHDQKEQLDKELTEKLVAGQKIVTFSFSIPQGNKQKPTYFEEAFQRDLKESLKSLVESYAEEWDVAPLEGYESGFIPGLCQKNQDLFWGVRFSPKDL